MRILVDTTIWSLVLRRRTVHLSRDEHALTREFEELVREGRVALVGAIRQEVLSGIRSVQQFELLRVYLRDFDDEPVGTVDYERAAADFNLCRAQGVQGSQVDFLLCAVAQRLDLAIFTTDGDFGSYAQHLPITLHQVRATLS